VLVKQKHVVLRWCWSWWWMACAGRWSVVIDAAWRCRCRFYLDSQLHCRQLHQPRCVNCMTLSMCCIWEKYYDLQIFFTYLNF